VGTRMSTQTVILRPEKLEVRGLVKRFPGGRRRAAVTAVDGIDLSVRAGELVCIVGASGCGKSTLLNVVGGLEEATEGVVAVDGERVIGPGPDRGMIFQTYSLFPWKTVAQNVAFGLEELGWPRAKRRERVAELLGVMGLTEWADRIPKQLSGGMRQRVAIARALAPEPDVLLLDEPFGALDAQTKRVMQDHLLAVWKTTGATILMVTHDVEEAVYLSSRVYVLTSHPGRVAAEVPIPFGPDRVPSLKRDPTFLDLRDQVQDLLSDQVRL
jgi:NitT/TauT family transport system ATP-binding protein